MRARRSTLSSAGRAVTAFIRPLFYRNLPRARAGQPGNAVGVRVRSPARRSGGECVPYPRDPRRLEAIEEHDVEPASRFLLPPKVVARRGDDPRLLARIAAGSGGPAARGP